MSTLRRVDYEMRPLVSLYVIPMLASHVQAGSRVWEIPATTAKSSSSVIMERAVVIKPYGDPNDNAGMRCWPEKTLTYAFENEEVEEKLDRLFEAGKRIWNQLTDKGFQYKKIKAKKCSAHRSDCLMVRYNDLGLLRTTVGLPSVEGNYVGPTMHLSDLVEVGNLDAAVNAAHEIGHAWGLWHEHQVKNYWSKDADQGGEFWNGDTWMFADYHPENLKDWEQALESMARAKGLASSEDLTKQDRDSLALSQDTAKEHGFSGIDWMPIRMGSFEFDKVPDKDSLMLYPSGCGAKGEVIRKDDNTFEDGRLPVLTYPDGKRMPLKKRPSGRDIEALEKLYESEYRGVSRLHMDKSSKFKGLFKKMRSTMSLRAGDTEQGMC
jgi:hypothetical protein